jgi:hypothetical protein
MSDTRRGEERKVSSLAELPAAVEPARDLWPQIEARIRQERTQARGTAPGVRSGEAPARPALFVPRRWLAATAVVACVAIGVWIGRHVESPLGATRGTTTPAGGPPILHAAYVTDPRYQRERAALLKSLQAQLAALPAPTREKVITSLATIQRAKQDLESALGQDPSNALLQELLVNTYQDEMRVLTDVQQAGEAGRGI